ncbi:MAG: hypothetical protein KGH94_00245 [Candidatus Micrarchaeota archaeon]|nr:hypothetical protein [Candidatus Micrarchaeota archaeon]
MLGFLLQAASGTYVAAGATFTENTIAVILTMIAVLALSIQIARGYFLRILRKFTLRLAADMWWLIYIILRDASIFLMVFLGFMFFWPGVYQDFPIGMPFAPLSIDLFAMALVMLLVVDTDEEPFYNSMLTILVIAGSLLYITGIVLVTESPVALSILPPTVSNSTSNIWGFANVYLNSVNNPSLSIYTFYVCFGILVLCGLVAILYSFKGGIFNRFIEPKPKPVVKDVMPPSEKK